MGRKRSSKNLSEMLKSKLLDLIRSGMTKRYVSNFYSVPRKTIRIIIKRNNALNNSVIMKQGRKQKLKPRCVRRLLKYVRENNRVPLFIVAARFRTLDGSKLTQRTIRLYLHESGIRSYFAASEPFLSAKHIAATLNWCVVRQQWTMQQWRNVAFKNESSFTLKPIKNHGRVWRKLSTRYSARNIIPSFKSGFVSLPVRRLFSARGRTPLVRINGTLNQDKYIQILKQFVLPFKDMSYPGCTNFMYQHEGCGPHRAEKVSILLDAKDVNVLPWLTQSPDLNPI